jgi:prepilin-type N-terminal cleavage/methylation domain-containing protein
MRTFRQSLGERALRAPGAGAHRAAFTLVELLAAMAIIAVLAAVAVPVVANAKRSSHRAVSASNLRQCGMALLMYVEDYDGMASMPLRPAADEALSRVPTCDPGDYLRQGCSAAAAAPMIGSYAYVRDKLVYGSSEGWAFYLRVHEQTDYLPALLINLFVSSKQHTKSEWFGPFPNPNPLPDRIQAFEADGGVRLYRPSSRPDIGYTWQTLFLKK